MAKGYSLDLRRRVFGAWQAGEGTQAQIAARFAVSVSFVRDLARRFRASGDVAAKPYGGGRAPQVNAALAQAIAVQVSAHNDLSIEEHRQRLAAQGHPLLAHSTLGHWLLRLRLTRKKRPSRTTRQTPRASKACGRPSGRRSPRSRLSSSSLSTRAGSTGR